MQRKQTLLLLAILLLSTAFLQAQNKTKISWGKEASEPKGTVISKVVSWNKNGIFALRIKNANSRNVADGPSKIYLEHYNRDMDLVNRKELSLKIKKKKREFEDLMMIGGQLYFFTSFNNQAKKKNYLFAQKISPKSLRPEANLTYIGEIDTKNKYQEGSFNFHISRDSSKVLVYNQLPYKKNTSERFALRVFDNEMQELWSKDIKLPYDDSQFAIEDYQVDNEGNVYLLGVLYTDGSALVRRRGKPNYKYVILAYNEAGEELTKYKIDLKGKFITDLTFRVANDGELICSGFYSEKGTYSIKGTYFFRVDPKEKQIFNKNAKEFDFDFRTEYVSEKRKGKLRNRERKGDAKKEAELNAYSLDHLILRNDGGALLIAEQYYVEEQVDNYGYGVGVYNQNVRYDYYYNYNDIIVVNINPNGEVEWTARIPKRQETRNDNGYFSSYAMSIVRDKIYFIYNDNAKNFSPNKKENRFYNYNGSNSIVAVTAVHQDGDVYTSPLFENMDANIITRPKVCRQIGKKEMVIFGERGRRSRFGKIRF